MRDSAAPAHDSDDTAAKSGISRRQLVKAGAWAAPAVVLTAAVPAASASGDHSVQIQSITSTKTGPWDDVKVSVKNNNVLESVTVTISLTTSGGLTLAAPTTRTLLIAAAATVDFTGFGAVSVANNGNHTLTATATVPSDWSAGLARSAGVRRGNTIPYVQ